MQNNIHVTDARYGYDLITAVVGGGGVKNWVLLKIVCLYICRLVVNKTQNYCLAHTRGYNSLKTFKFEENMMYLRAFEQNRWKSRRKSRRFCKFVHI